VNHTRKEDVVWFYGSVFAMPMLVLGLGFFMTRKRRGARRAQADAGAANQPRKESAAPPPEPPAPPAAGKEVTP
jgi:hypothetical protein